MKSILIPLLLCMIALQSYNGLEAMVDETTNSVIPINAGDGGRVFDGIGALSAGASSRLLIDYPEPQRGEILDYLFKPNFGAALQINKVEIGGDMNSTDGSEPSHSRTPDDHNYQRGYEWWLMEESKKRNPNVKLWGLEWGAPGWINPSTNNVWTKENITYLIDWVDHAKSDHGLTIDYLGGWNEKGNNPAWYIDLRKALDTSGHRELRVVADDSFKWEIGGGMATNPAFASAFEIIGMHYPPLLEKMSTNSVQMKNWQTCVSSGKPLWGSEIGSGHYNRGATALARLYNRGYIDEKMTSFINWSTIWSVLPGMPFSGDGLMLADQPWSGAYEVGLSIWATAHTTQFAKPGWQYLDGACGYFSPDGKKGGNEALISTNSTDKPESSWLVGTFGYNSDYKEGSYVTLCSPDGKDFSVIVETVDAMQPRDITFSIKGDLLHGPLHVWKTIMDQTKPENWFIQQQDVLPDAKGNFAVSFDPRCLYSITTTTGQHKGCTTPPPRTQLTLPFRDSFQSLPPGKTQKYFSDQHGTFETAISADGKPCLRQVITAKPVFWNSDADPCTLIGDPSWKDFKVASKVLLEQPGYVELLGRVSGGGQNEVPGYHLRLTDAGHWSLLYRNPKQKQKEIPDNELASGDLKGAVGTGKWHELSLGFLGNKITASIDGTQVVQDLTDTHDHEAVARKATSCFTGYATSRWENAEFRDFNVNAITETP